MKLEEIEKLISTKYPVLGDVETFDTFLISRDIRDGFVFELTIQEENNLYFVKKKIEILGEESVTMFHCELNSIENTLDRIATSIEETDKIVRNVVREVVYDVLVSRRRRVDTIVTRKKKEVFNLVFGQLTLSVNENTVKVNYHGNTVFGDKKAVIECDEEEVALDTFNYFCYVVLEATKKIKNMYLMV